MTYETLQDIAAAIDKNAPRSGRSHTEIDLARIDEALEWEKRHPIERREKYGRNVSDLFAAIKKKMDEKERDHDDHR